MARGTAHPQELRAQVVSELLAGSGSIGQVARRYGVRKSTVASWVAHDAPQHDATAAEAERVGQRYDALGEALLDLVGALNQTIIRQCAVLGDPEWVSRQDAADMALLIECLNNRQIHVLSGFKAPVEQPAQAGP